MLNNKLITGIALIGVIAITAGVTKTLNNSNKSASMIVTHAETTNAAAVSPQSTQSSPADSAKPTNLNTPRNVLFLNAQVDEYSVNGLITQLQSLEGSKEPIYLLIDSPGGSVFDGARLITQMESMKTPVNTVCVGLCASMGAMIHSFGKQRLITPRSALMYHPASGGAQGQVQNMQSRINFVFNYVSKLESNIQRRSGMTKDDYDRRISYELWVDSDEAKALKLVDDVVYLNTTLPPQSNSKPEDNRNKRNNTIRDFDLIWMYNK